MALSIKNEETEQLAREVARQNGETITTAVTVALKERFARQHEIPERKSRSEVLREFSELCAPLFTDGRSGNDLINDLYDDETGLPK
jgi:antitoxin VapB